MYSLSSRRIRLDFGLSPATRARLGADGERIHPVEEVQAWGNCGTQWGLLATNREALSFCGIH